MHFLWIILNYYMFLKLTTLDVVTGTALQYPIPVVTNKVKSVDVSCDSASFNATVLFEQPFRGLFFAKDFSQECRSLGNFSDMITLTLPTNGCGLRLSSYIDKSGLIHMKYSLTLVIQQDRQLRQIADQERSVTCEVENSEFLVKSKLMADVIRSNLLGDKKNERNGRMQHDGWSKDPPTDTAELTKKYQDLLQSARAWMEIIPDGKTDNSLTKLKVGEPAKLIVKSTLPVGIGWKVVECNAHDGLGDTSQKLIDERGCPVDDVLMPMPEAGPVRSIAMMKHQEAVSKFIAFKFPDRDRLHVSCGLQLCRDDCLQEDCSTNITLLNRQGKALTRGNSGEILDQLEVFNSVEVFAPTIDDIRKNNKREQTAGKLTNDS